MIEQFYLNPIWDSNRWITLDQSGTESNEGVLYITKTLGLEPHHPIHFSIVPRYLGILNGKFYF